MTLDPMTLDPPARTGAPALISCLLRGPDAMITVAGTVDRAEIARLSAVLHGLCDADISRVLLDLTGVTACDASLAPVIDTLRRRVRAGGGWLVVDGTPAALGVDLGISLTEAFRIYRDTSAHPSAVKNAVR